ncbi:MAG: hypothetical protein KKF12_00710 [Proteobacteria bacterium]|nr:hypothetical protein [Desulfobacula sp.]MBU3952990.1 hypothetical protein [Pseudomonadota bacterium]MBU4129319.1 hypothetical protein [Pseudomonadota bacterium]
MAEKMTISDAVDAFSLYDLFSEILDSYGEEFDIQSSVASDLFDLIAEHEEDYEFLPDSDGDYSESFERNLKEAVAVIFEEHGLNMDFESEYSEDEYSEEAMDDDDIPGLYSDEFEENSDPEDNDDFDEDADSY